MLQSILYSLATVPLFASRPFLAAFLTALLARWGTHIPWLGDKEVVIALSQSPEWFRSGWCLAVLAALALGEALSAKHAEVRALMQELDAWVKSAVALLVALAVLDKSDAETIRSIHKQGLAIDSAWSLVIAVGVWCAAKLRQGALAIVHEIDDHDDIGLQTALSWAENSWVVLGVFFFVIAPLLALCLSLLAAAGLWLAQRWARREEERQRIPCSACATPVYPHALRCQSCGQGLASPRAVGVFGQPKPEAAGDLRRQRFLLIARKRCPVCATRLVQRAVQQACPACRTVTFGSRLEFEEYRREIDSRLLPTLFVCLLFSAIPVVGVIPGVIYYRLNLVTGFRGYIPPVSGCLARFWVRFVHWGLILLQPVPLFGALMLPLMCWSTYAVYRRALGGSARKALPATAS
jgi:Zn finger protein HypA/HybF involved in hydrogenase expression